MTQVNSEYQSNVADGQERAQRQVEPPSKQSLHARPNTTLARGLGLFSIGLGLAELLIPRQFAEFIGVQTDATTQSVIRGLGLREIAAGVVILLRPRPVGGVRSRVMGDAMDLALLGAALQSDDTDKERVMFALTAVIGVTALDLWESNRLGREPTITE